MKKNNLLLFVMLIAILCSCEKDLSSIKSDSTDVEITETETIEEPKEINVSIIDGILSFESEEDFVAFAWENDGLASSERIAWENNKGFVSMKTEYEAIYAEYEAIEDFEVYLNFKESNKYLWEFSDDDENAFVTYPIDNKLLASALTIDGEVYVGDTLLNAKTMVKPVLKGAEVTFCSSNYEKRRVEGSLNSYNGTTLLIVEGFKKYLWSWHNYTTKHYFRVTGTAIPDDVQTITIYYSDGTTKLLSGDDALIEDEFYWECEKIRYKFTTPVGYLYWPKIKFHVWTRGVPDSNGCDVLNLGIYTNIMSIDN